MSKTTEIESDGAVHAEACAWIAQLESGDLSEADRLELKRWMEKSPSHEATLREYAQFWSSLDLLAVMQPAYDETLNKSKSARSNVSRYSVWSLKLVSGIASGFILVIAAVSAVLIANSHRLNEQMVVATAVGEAKEVSLSDGSSINVNTSSNVQVNFNKHERAIHLTNGEAVFSVAHEKDRPFVVHAGLHAVKAVGTEFAVHVVDDQIDVFVTEGRVEIIPADASNPEQQMQEGVPSAVLVQGQSARATLEGVKTIESVSLEKLEQRLSWRNGILDFSGETLQYAVHELMRYTPYEIEIDGVELANRKVGGVFQLADADQLIEVLEQNFAINAVEVGDRRVVLRPLENEK